MKDSDPLQILTTVYKKSIYLCTCDTWL